MTSREVNRVGEGQKNIPKLRFKGYEDAWEQRKLGNVAKYRNGKAHEQSVSENGKYVIVNSKFVSTNGEVQKFSCEQIAPLFKNEIAFVLSDVPNGRAIARTFLIPHDDKYTLNQRIAGITPNETTDCYFLHLLMNRNHYFLRFDDGVKQTNLSVNDVMGFSTYYPLYEEQQLCGQFFQKIDNLITLHQRKYDALKTMKKTLLSKMFPKDGEDVPEIRFKEFTDAWEQRKLGEVSQIVGGGTPSTGIPEYWDGDIDWYSPVEIGEEIFVSCSQRKITQLGLEKSSAKILPVGTVLFTSRAGIGNTAILEKEGCTNQGFQSIVPKDNELDSYFIFSCSHLLKKYGETKGAGSTFVEISGKQMSLMPLNIPEIKEQKSVGNFFRKLDSIITLHQRKLDELKNMKKTLLQQMFV